jgi:cytochrome b6-f complex iron-sulfur subunit
MAAETRPPETVASPPASKPIPAKPAVAAKAPTKAGTSRRGFLATAFGSWFGIAWTSFCVSMSAMFLYTLRFLFPNVNAEPPSKFKAGSTDQYAPGEVVERYKQEFGVWIIRDEKQIFALSTTCTHLGCTPNWLENEQKFKCPCHGSGFKKDGVNFEGPAPRPLERYRIVLEEGFIVVDKSKKYQQELGQWSDPEASIKV